MRLICKSNIDILSGETLSITINKEYKIIFEDNFGYKVLDDEERLYWYSKYHFHNIEDSRDIIISKFL